VHASLAQAQQQAAEWEQRANENAAALEEAQAVRDQAEDRASQLEAENVLLRMQLDEKERLTKVRVAPCLVAEVQLKGSTSFVLR
jgi:RNA polymerase-binding transcription factor DksA